MNSMNSILSYIIVLIQVSLNLKNADSGVESCRDTPIEPLTSTDRGLGVPAAPGAGELLGPLELESVTTGEHQQPLPRLVAEQEAPVLHVVRKATGVVWARSAGDHSERSTPSGSSAGAATPSLPGGLGPQVPPSRQDPCPALALPPPPARVRPLTPPFIPALPRLPAHPPEPH